MTFYLVYIHKLKFRMHMLHSLTRQSSTPLVIPAVAEAMVVVTAAVVAVTVVVATESNRIYSQLKASRSGKLFCYSSVLFDIIYSQILFLGLKSYIITL